MVDISSGNKKISITVSSTGNKGNVSTNPDMSMFYTERSKEWAISDKIVNNEDYSSKYYAQKSKEQAQISTEKTEEVVNSGNAALNNINTAENSAITNIINQEVLSIENVNNTGISQINNIKTEGAKQVTLATNQANIATEKANIATTQAGIATSKTTEVIEGGNTALANIDTAKSNALNEIKTTGAGYVENAEQYAQDALTSANNAALSESNALSYKNSIQESAQTATEQANIAVTNANKATTSATNAKTSETNAKSSEVRCEEILSRLGTAIKIKGRVDSLDDLPLSGNIDGDAYLVGQEGLDSYPEYYWYQDHWEFLGTSGTSLSWGLITGNIAAQADLQTALDNKQDKLTAINAGDNITIKEVAIGGGLPYGYTQLEYIESTGTQYINTGVVLNSTMTVRIKYDFIKLGFVFGSRKTENASYSGIVNESTGIYNIRYGNKILYTADAPPLGTTDVVISPNGVTLNGVVVSTTSYGTDFYSGNCLLFTMNRGGETYVGEYASNRIRRFAIDNVIDLIPARRNSDNELGMYDTVTGNFLINAGTGTFIAGAVSEGGEGGESATALKISANVPTNNNQLTNGAGYITADYHDSTKQDVITDLDSYVKNTDYATTASGGVVKISDIFGTRLNNGVLYAEILRAGEYDRYSGSSFVSKGTLENIKENLVTSIGDTKYQSTLTSGENIKTINGESVLGSGDIEIKGGGSLEVCDIGMALYVDETKGLRRYLNGQIVDINTNTQAFLNRLKDITTLHPSLLCTEDEWQTAKTMSAFGQVGKFVFNYADDGVTVISVRIPRVVNIQGLFDLQNLGMTVAESLPNFEIVSKTSSAVQGGTAPAKTKLTTVSQAYGISTSATSYGETSPAGMIIKGSSLGQGTSFIPDSSIYQDNAHVQPEAIQYPYFIQIATGSETEANIVNTLENVNGFTLLESKYSDKPLYNESWLLSNGQWNSKAVYPTAYEGLQVEYNTEIEVGTTVTLPSGVSYTKRGLSVKLSTEEYTDYYFVLNTADETFRLPLLDGSESLPSAKRYMYELPTYGGQQYTALYNGIIQLNAISSATNQYVSLVNTTTGEYDEMRAPLSGVSNVCNIQVKAGDIFTVNGDVISTINWLANIKYTGNGSLYFYVGDLDQNHGIVNMGRIGEQLAGKVDVSNTQWATNACMPDYSAGVTQYVDTEYTATINGFVYVFAFGNLVGHLSVNGIDIHFQNGNAGNIYVGASCFIPVAKNDVYKFTWSGGSQYKMIFFPMKGAN